MPLIKLEDNVTKILKSHEYVVSLNTVIKELIQNSVDADATNIVVKVETDKCNIRVQDNGQGLEPNCLNILGSRNVTSKIRSLQELPRISTYGFRGEALYMILQCSRMNIVTKPIGYSGVWKTEFTGTVRLCTNTERDAFASSQNGTIVNVRDLFYNLPVRREMHKRRALSDILNELRTDALSILIKNPKVFLKVYVNGDLKISSWRTHQSLDAPQRIVGSLRDVFGDIIPEEQLKYVSASFKSYSVKGIISTHPIMSKDYQYIFINGRKYEDSKFFSLINRQFQATKYVEKNWESFSVKSVGTPYNSYPLFLISCDGPLDISDLIQDPGKTIFQSQTLNILSPLILNVVLSFLRHLGYDISKEFPQPVEKYFIDKPEFYNGVNKPFTLPTITKSSYNTSKMSKSKHKKKLLDVLKSPPKDNSIILKLQDKINVCTKFNVHGNDLKHDSEFDIRTLSLTGTESIYLKDHAVQDFKLLKSDINKFEVIKQIDCKFILVKSQSRLLIIDQHACHERIMVESILKDTINMFHNRTISCSDTDMNIKVSVEEFDWFNEFLSEFEAWGIFLRLNEGNDEESLITILKMPSFLHDKVRNDHSFLKSVLLQHVYDLKNDKRRRVAKSFYTKGFSSKWWMIIPNMPRVYLEIINSKACRSSIMFGTSLSKEECKIMISELSCCHFPFQCAHGRPSVVPIVEINDNMFNSMHKDYEIL